MGNKDSLDQGVFCLHTGAPPDHRRIIKLVKKSEGVMVPKIDLCPFTIRLSYPTPVPCPESDLIFMERVPCNGPTIGGGTGRGTSRPRRTEGGDR